MANDIDDEGLINAADMTEEMMYSSAQAWPLEEGEPSAYGDDPHDVRLTCFVDEAPVLCCGTPSWHMNGPAAEFIAKAIRDWHPNQTEVKALRDALAACADELEESVENEGRLASFTSAAKKARALLSPDTNEPKEKDDENQ